jgi:hypothetical protein
MQSDAPCLVAAFGSSRIFEAALGTLHGAGVGEIETYTPTPVDAPTGASPAGVVGLAAGLFGGAGAFAMQIYANIWAYPLDIGGRPKFSWPSFAPIALEVGILFAVLGVLTTVCVTAPLLRLHAPIDDCDLIHRASTDRWVVAISSTDSQAIARARDICTRLGALQIEAFG